MGPELWPGLSNWRSQFQSILQRLIVLVIIIVTMMLDHYILSRALNASAQVLSPQMISIMIQQQKASREEIVERVKKIS